MVKWFFLLIDFLVVEDYELPKSTSHIWSVPTLEFVRILSWFISFCTLMVSLIMFCATFLSELIILLSTHHVTNHLTCRNKLRYPMICNLTLKIWKCNTRIYQFCTQLNNDIWGIILYLQANPYRLNQEYQKPYFY